MDSIETAVSRLKESGLKLTKQRKTLIDYLNQYQNKYVPITQIDDYMREVYPGLSHNTIYRNIQDFSSVGIVEQRLTKEQTLVKFQCDFKHTHHHHFICRNCGKVIELKMCPLDFFEKQIPDCDVEGHSFELYGLCGDCKKA